MTDWMNRAIWSAPPPVPAGTTNSTVLLGSHANAGASAVSVTPTSAAMLLRMEGRRIMRFLLDYVVRDSSWGHLPRAQSARVPACP